MNSKFSRLLLRFAGSLVALTAVSLHASSACCQGAGDFGLEGDWHGPAAGGKGPKTVTFSNASFESSRALFAELNADFAKQWAKKTGFKLTVNETHGGTEAQARSIHLGAEPDIVSLDNPGAIDEFASKSNLLPADWQSRLPNNSSPYTTTVVFLVEKGNPKGIKDWSDLVRDGVKVITPDPRTSGRGQWNYLAAWGYAQRQQGGEKAALDFVTRLYDRVPVLSSSARGSTETFAKRGEGDVLLVWESDAYELVKQSGKRDLEVVTPSTTIMVEPPVAWVDANIGKHENARVSISFAKYLYTPDAQEIIARHYFRPRLAEASAKAKVKLPATQVFTVAEVFGSWTAAAQQHFAKGQEADRILHTAENTLVAPLHVAAR